MSQQFAVGEIVLVPYVDKHYEAKVTKAEKRDGGQWFYHLHYTGWGKDYDEWVEQNVLIKSAQFDQSKATAAPKSGTKRQRQGGDAGEAPVAAAKLEVIIPVALKKALIENYDATLIERRLLPLPRPITVVDLLARFTATAAAEAGAATPVASGLEQDLAEGLKMFFDKTLRSVLLYATEFQQADGALAAGRTPSHVYGAEHLLRLFVKLPEMYPAASVGKEQLAVLKAKIAALLRWMVANQASLLAKPDDYLPPAPMPPAAPTAAAAAANAVPQAPAAPAAANPAQPAGGQGGSSAGAGTSQAAIAAADGGQVGGAGSGAAAMPAPGAVVQGSGKTAQPRQREESEGSPDGA